MLLVIADDRTGALETAGACAESGWSTVAVTDVRDAVTAEVVVVDIASRHLSPERAAVRAVAADRRLGVRRAHKIDSTLRGNWAAELAALQRAGGGPTLLVPAFPAAGRTCRDGVVEADGVPVAEGPAGRDPLTPVRSSRPAELLADAGATDVVECPDPRAARRWRTMTTGGIAVCDASSDDELAAYAAWWAADPALRLAGTAAMIGAGARALAPDLRRMPLRPAIETPVLVVCASLHPAARAQLDALERRGWTSIDVGRPSPPIRLDGSSPGVVLRTSPERSRRGGTAAAEALGVAARRLLDDADIRTLVVVGGDTATAVLGDRALPVGGLLAPGVAWCRRSDGPLTITKPGGFGGPELLADLLDGSIWR